MRSDKEHDVNDFLLFSFCFQIHIIKCVANSKLKIKGVNRRQYNFSVFNECMYMKNFG